MAVNVLPAVGSDIGNTEVANFSVLSDGQVVINKIEEPAKQIWNIKVKGTTKSSSGATVPGSGSISWKPLAKGDIFVNLLGICRRNTDKILLANKIEVLLDRNEAAQ